MLSKLSLATAVAQAYYQGNEECGNFNGNVGCKGGDDTRYPDDWSKRAFQTFLEDGPDAHMFKKEYEGLGRVMCYNQAVYNVDRTSATVYAQCRTHESVVKTEYKWGEQDFSSDGSFQADSSFKDDLVLIVKATDGDGKDW